MKSGIFAIDIFKDLNYDGRIALAKCTKNPEILTMLSEDHNEYVRGQVVQNINTPIYILTKMLEEYDKVPFDYRNESHESGYRKKNIEETLKSIQNKLGKDQFEKTKRIEEILYGKKHFI
jgi:hypothetical protein